MPREALRAEHLAAILPRRFSEPAWEDPELLPMRADEVNAELAAALGSHELVITPTQIASTCLTFAGLAARWSAVQIGDHLEVRF